MTSTKRVELPLAGLCFQGSTMVLVEDSFKNWIRFYVNCSQVNRLSVKSRMGVMATKITMYFYREGIPYLQFAIVAKRI